MMISKARASSSVPSPSSPSSSSSCPSSQVHTCSSSSYGGTLVVSKRKSCNSSVPDLHQLLASRDYTGAITLLQLKHLENVCDVMSLEWLAYCHFHHGEHDKSLNVYKQLLSQPNAKPVYHTYAAACLFYIGLYDEAETAALKGPTCSLQVRILFHVAHKKKDEKALMEYHEKLGETVEDQLSLASFHYLQASYQEATDIYKTLLLEHRDWLALNVYVALCYYNLDFHDVSLEILNAYLQAYPDSLIASNLKACHKHKLWGGKVAATDLRALKEPSRGMIENDLLQHNLAVFQHGEGALQVFPRLVNIFPEAQLNTAVHHLNNGELRQAYEVVRNIEPTSPQEFIIKAVTCACLGQEINSEDLLQQAQHLFQVIGSSATECDTTPGRQCMASFFFLNKQFEDAIMYLKSIKNFCKNMEEFKWNYGIAKACVGEYVEAEEILLSIHSEKMVEDYYYYAWVSFCLIMNGKAHLAWERYLQLDALDDSFSLLQLFANECYKTGQFMYSAKAFGILVQSNEQEEYWEGLRGACVGAFQNIIEGKESEDNIEEILILLGSCNNPQGEYISNIIKKWSDDNLLSS